MSDPIILLDGPQRGRLLCFVGPLADIEAFDPAGIGSALAALEEARAKGHYLAGYFGYELGYVLEPRLGPLLPEGRNGPLSRSLASYAAYYQRWASVWEAQALLRARPVAGAEDVAAEFIALVDPVRYPEPGIGADDVREIRRLKGRIDDERHAQVATFLAIQEKEAQWWRDASIAYFQTFAQRPLPDGEAPPAHTLDYYESLEFPFAPGNG